MSLWLQELLARSDGTVGGLADQLAVMPRSAQPEPLKAMPAKERQEAYARLLHDTLMTVNIMQDTFEQEWQGLAEVGTPTERCLEESWDKVSDMQDWLKWSGVPDDEQPWLRRRVQAELQEVAETRVSEQGAQAQSHNQVPPDCPRDHPRALDKPAEERRTVPEPSRSAAGDELRRALPAAPARADARSAAGDELSRTLPAAPARADARALSIPPEVQQQAPVALRFVEHSARKYNIREPLLLIGDASGWDVPSSLGSFRLVPCSGRNPKPDRQESKICIEVPVQGTSFVIASAAAPSSWVLIPGWRRQGRHPQGDTHRGLLRDGCRDDSVRIAVGNFRDFTDFSHHRFEIRGGREPFGVDVRVALREGQPPQVWFTEA